MFCPKCGKELKEGARFCTACGTQVSFAENDFPKQEPANNVPNYEQPAPAQNDANAGYESRGYNETYGAAPANQGYEDSYDGYDDYYEETPAPKKSKKPLIITLAIIAAAVVVGLVLYFAVFAKGGFGKSGGTLEEATTRTVEAFAGRSDATSFLKNYAEMEKFGVNVKVDSIGDILSLYNSYMSVLNIEAEVDIAADKKGNASVTVNADGMGLQANAGAYIEEGKSGDIVVSIPKFLDDAYGISLGSIAEDFDDSIFSPDSDTEYSMPDYMYDQYKVMLEGVQDGMGNVSPEALEKLKEELKTNEDSKLDFERSKEKIEIGEDEVSCEVYKTSIDTDKIEGIFNVILDWADENMDLAPILASMGGGSISMSDLSKQLSSALAEVDIDLDLEIDICKGYLARTELSGKIQGQKVKIEAVFGADPAKSDEISVTAKAGEADFSLVVDMSKADDNKISAVAESKAADVYFEFDFVYDDKDKEFEMSLKNAYREFEASGGMDASEKTVVISDPKIKRDGETLFELKGITITFTKDAEVRTAKKDFPDGYTNILKLKESEFEDLGDKLYDMLGEMG